MPSFGTGCSAGAAFLGSDFLCLLPAHAPSAQSSSNARITLRCIRLKYRNTASQLPNGLIRMNTPATPLAERMRPHRLEDFIGQEHLVAPGKVLYNMAASRQLRSIIFWGPPGVGKTTLAMILAESVGAPFFTLSAIDSGVKEVRAVIEQARLAGGAVLFIDEIHRFNKSQQDSLLGAVERGIITLIGATTENPSFEVISALLSRCQVYVLKPLDESDLMHLLQKAMQQDEVMKKYEIDLKETEALINISGGDARKLLNLLELVIDT